MYQFSFVLLLGGGEQCTYVPVQFCSVASAYNSHIYTITLVFLQ